MSNKQLIYQFPYEIKDVPTEINNELLHYFKGERTGFVQVGPKNYFFPNSYRLHAENFYNFQARADDVWVLTFPRSGTTWTQELVWLLANKLDFEQASKRYLTERFPFFEFSLFVHPEVKKELLQENADDIDKLKFIENAAMPGYELLNDIPTNCRRFIKTHFPFSLLPPSVMQQKCKIIFVRRNPLDVAVSFFHLNRLFRTQGYTGDFERYWHYFENGLNTWMPFYSHLEEALAHKHHSNVLFLDYDKELQKDLRGSILKVAKFLDTIITEEELQKLQNHLNIVNFRNNPSVNGVELKSVGIINGETEFVRSGTSSANGVHQEFANHPEIYERAQKWMQKNEKKLPTI